MKEIFFMDLLLSAAFHKPIFPICSAGGTTPTDLGIEPPSATLAAPYSHDTPATAPDKITPDFPQADPAQPGFAASRGWRLVIEPTQFFAYEARS